jgi:hypothetical protein
MPTVAERQGMIESAEHVTPYFRDFFAQADTDIVEGDPEDVQIQKYMKRGTILGQIVAEASTPGFLSVQKYLMDKARECENQVFDAILKSDSKESLRLAIVHTGILEFFEVFEGAAIELQNVAEKLAELTKPAPADDLSVPSDK